jgi:hypothetical protein
VDGGDRARFSGSHAEYRWLTGAEAAEWLAELAARDEPLVPLTARLRKTWPAARTQLLLEQVALRRRAKEKWSLASSLESAEK